MELQKECGCMRMYADVCGCVRMFAERINIAAHTCGRHTYTHTYMHTYIKIWVKEVCHGTTEWMAHTLEVLASLRMLWTAAGACGGEYV